jgi:hypothetical protein
MIQPFTETKDRLSAQAVGAAPLTIANAFTILTPDSFLFNEQGLQEGQMIGQSIYSRFLSMKLLLEFPQGLNQLFNPTKIYAYQVWITAPLAASAYTVATGQLRRDLVTRAYLEQHISDQAKEFYDNKNDRMKFSPVMEGVKVIRRIELTPNRNAAIAGNLDDNAGTVFGGPPDVFHQFQWDTKTKIHYEKSSTIDGPADLYLNRPPENLGYPAVIIYNPDFARQGPGDERKIKHTYTSKHWYGDS